MIQEVKAWMVECEGFDRIDGHEVRCGAKTGPHFAAYKSEVSVPEGWGYRTLTDCGLTGYTRRDLFCDNCIKRHGIEIDQPKVALRR